MAELVLLDYDGVIVDSAQPVLHQTASFCKEQGLAFDLTLADFDRLDPATFTMLAQVCGIPKAAHRSYGRFLFDTLQTDSARIALFDGIREMLRDLCQRHILCVVTANHADVVRTRLAQEGLGDCIHTVYGSDRPGDKADHIRDALNEHAIDSTQAWMVGDSVSDIDAARAGGVNALAVSWGWQSAALLQKRMPDHLFHTPQDLHAFLSEPPVPLPAVAP
ncbi:MAG: HAD family hydrolase [Arenicellales bacterium]|jgi:phosphoglycolate phosphatase|nr:HAD family hydrolase [Arenicellales bacterium]|tara:strand:+ start:6394 stop:7053 length:660 start_codon:yes stop_codon:yes gene_type:complete